MAAKIIPTQYGPEYYLIVIGYSSDSKEAVDTIASLQADLQGELDKFRLVNPGIPFNRVEFWKWESHAAAAVGGQAAVITPEMQRANAAVFIFTDRVGKVTWEELNLIRSRTPAIPILPFFPAKPPADARMMEEGVAELWAELLKKRGELAKDWSDPETRAVTPLPLYADLKQLKSVAFERLTKELVRVASSFNNVTPPPPPIKKQSVHQYGNVLSISPYAESRYSSLAVTTMLDFEGPCLVIDPTGQIYEKTARDREMVGAVIKLDPWGQVPDERVGSLNPIDIVNALGFSLSEGARFLADLLIPYHTYQYRRRIKQATDPFWPNMERKLIVGLAILAMTEEKSSEGILTRIRGMLNGDDTVYNFAVKLDTVGKKLKETAPEAYDELSTFLQQVDHTRSGILAGANQHFGAFGSLVVQRSTDSSSFEVAQWIRGDPMTVYVIGPPAGISAFEAVYTLWNSCLLYPALARPQVQQRPTKILIDMTESFECWPGISTALSQNARCRCAAIVADASDVQIAFGDSANSILSSFSTIEAFRPKNAIAAARTAGLLGVTSNELLALKSQESLVFLDGKKTVKAASVTRE
jgi:hypothetical protein